MKNAELEQILETAVLTSDRPVTVKQLRSMFNGRISYDRIETALRNIQSDWAQKQRGFRLVEVASGWRFQTEPDVQPYLDRLNPEKPLELGRAALEILTIIAYRQPTTRADIETIRGVTVRPQSLHALEARGWIEVIGTRPTIGRPEIFATTAKFLDELGLSSLSQLPDLLTPDELPGFGLPPPDESQVAPASTRSEPIVPGASPGYRA